jgi:hypothetical protein
MGYFVISILDSFMEYSRQRSFRVHVSNQHAYNGPAFLKYMRRLTICKLSD